MLFENSDCQPLYSDQLNPKWVVVALCDLIYVGSVNVCGRRGDRHFTWSSELRKGLAAGSAKGVPSFLSLSTAPAQKIEAATSRSVVKRSTG